MKKNAFTLILILIALIGVFIFYNVRAIHEEAKHVVETNLNREANYVSSEFSSWINGEIRMIETLRDIVKNIPLSKLKEMSKENPYLKLSQNTMNPYIGFEDGSMVLGDSRLIREGYDPRERIWYTEATMEDTTRVSEVYLGAEYGRPMITISTPLYMDGKRVGVLGVDILISDILGGLERELDIPKAHGFIVSESGIILSHTLRTEWIGKPLDVLEMESEEEIYSIIKNGEEGTIVFMMDGKPTMAAIKHLNGVEWIVGIAVEESIIKDEIGLFSEETTIINFLFFIVMLFIVKNLYDLEKVVFNTNELLRNKMYELHLAYDNIDEINRQIEAKSNIDDLTSVANRGFFDKTLENYWKQGIKDSCEIGLLIFDVDYFKSYNDIYGYAYGDQVLIDICVLVNSMIDDSDFFARITGEEFAIIGYGKGIESYTRLAEALRKSITDLVIPHEGSPYHLLTVSMGVHSIVPKASDTMGSFYHEGDMAVYHSKKAGRNKTTVYSEEI